MLENKTFAHVGVSPSLRPTGLVLAPTRELATQIGGGAYPTSPVSTARNEGSVTHGGAL